MHRFFIYFALLIYSISVKGQDAQRVDDIKGYRLKPNVNVYVYYTGKDNSFDVGRYRRLNNSVFFTRFTPDIEIVHDGTTYVQIIVPGTQTDNLNVDNGGPISSSDYDKPLWISKTSLDNLSPEYYKYRSDIVLGALTLPFKFRPKLGNQAPSLIDGSFNVGPYFGWKWRLGNQRPFYLSTIISGGVTSMTYNSANNSGITDSEKAETGFGFQYCTGVVFDLYKVQLGIVGGADAGMGDLSNTFKYQNRLWFAFSLNFNFLAPKTNEEANKNDPTP